MVSCVRIILLLLSFATIDALRRKSERSQDQYTELSWKQHYLKYTEDLSVTSNPKGMNAKCKPIYEEPSGPSRGLVVLQHGFSACAGFWYLLAPQLVQAGWTVVAPNMPGHGRSPTVTANGTDSYVVTDYSDDLPERGTGFSDYSEQLAEIGRKYKSANAGKEMAIVGCSHGAAVAMYTVMRSEVGTWDRLMLMQPFLAPPTALGADYGLSALRVLIPQVLPALGLFREDKISWGAGCEQRRWPGHPQTGGHGGFCQFGLLNFRGVLEFGNLVEAEARTRAAKLGVFTGGVIDIAHGITQHFMHNAWEFFGGAKPPPVDIKIQILATAFDGSVSNQRIHFLYKAIKKSTVGHHSGCCAMDRDFEHTFINPVDKALDKDMWWLDPSRVQGGKSVLDMLEDFVSEGILFPTDGTVQDDKGLIGDDRCGVNKK